MLTTDSKHDHQILKAIASGQRVTQRSLSDELGVALGLANLLVRRLVGKGYVRMAGMGTRHVSYLMTPTGWEALGRTTRQSLEDTRTDSCEPGGRCRALWGRCLRTEAGGVLWGR